MSLLDARHAATKPSRGKLLCWIAAFLASGLALGVWLID